MRAKVHIKYTLVTSRFSVQLVEYQYSGQAGNIWNRGIAFFAKGDIDFIITHLGDKVKYEELVNYRLIEGPLCNIDSQYVPG